MCSGANRSKFEFFRQIATSEIAFLILFSFFRSNSNLAHSVDVGTNWEDFLLSKIIQIKVKSYSTSIPKSVLHSEQTIKTAFPTTANSSILSISKLVKWSKLLMFVLLSPSGDLGVGLVWDNHPSTRSILVWVLKSSSNWTKLTVMGPQLFSGWCAQMFKDVLRCSEMS